MCKEEKIESKFLMSARKFYNFILVVDSSNSQAKNEPKRCDEELENSDLF